MVYNFICKFKHIILKTIACNNYFYPINETNKMIEPDIHWRDYEDIALKLYERFGDDFTESKIYRIRFTELLEWVLEIPQFVGKREESNEGHLEMIQSSWVYEWRDNQK
jgi:FeS assembly protein IscX